MQKLMITLFSKVLVSRETDKLDPALLASLNTEVATLGYQFDGSLSQAIASLSRPSFDRLRADLIETLGGISGAKANHFALFRKFPYDTPDKRSFLIARTLGYLQSALMVDPGDMSVLDCGHVIDHRRFDMRAFNGCPICGKANLKHNTSGDDAVHPFEPVSSLKVLGFADAAVVADAASTLLARKSSLSAAEKDFLKQAAAVATIVPPKALFKETLPFAYEIFGEAFVAPFISGARDVLRIATYVSSDTADLSLKENTKFRLATRHKKAILRLLETTPNLDEDLLRDRERWLRIGERLNPGAADNAKRYPRVAAAFDTLRNRPKAIRSFNRTVESKLRSGTIDPELLATLSSRPGEFMRRLDHLLRTVSFEAGGEIKQMILMEELKAVVRRVPAKLLFEIEKYLGSRADMTGMRVFIPKGAATKMKVVPDTRSGIEHSVVKTAREIVETELVRRAAVLAPLGKVHIDPRLSGMVMPFNRRGDSLTSLPISKGSRYPIATDAKVIRLFIHWTGRDVDLSAVFYNDDFTQTFQVSFTNLKWGHQTKGGVVVHSGDITHAPDGASEFIDIDIENLAKTNRNMRYVAMSVISFSGEPFNAFPCFAGFMERDATASGALFQPESVALKFEVAAATKSHLPLVFDLMTREVIFADIASGGRRGGFVGGQGDKYSALTQAVVNLPKTKPTVADILTLHALARGSTLVATPEEADHAFTFEALDFDAISADFVDVL